MFFKNYERNVLFVKKYLNKKKNKGYKYFENLIKNKKKIKKIKKCQQTIVK